MKNKEEKEEEQSKNEKHAAGIKFHTDIPPARLATVFTFIMGSALFLPLFASNRGELIWAVTTMTILGIAIIGYGIHLGNANKRIDLIVVPSTNQLRVQRKGWFEMLPQEEFYEMEELEGVDIVESTGSDMDEIFRPILILKNGKQVSISHSWYYAKPNDLVDSLNSVIYGKANLSQHACGNATARRLILASISTASILLIFLFSAHWYHHHEMKPMDFAEISMGLFMTMFSTVWIYCAIAGICKERSNPISWLFPLLGVPFLAIGLSWIYYFAMN